MAKAWVNEYAEIGESGSGHNLQVAVEPALVSQTVTFTTSSQSNEFGDATKYVHIVADAACHVAFGINPTATADSRFLPSGSEMWAAVRSGHKVAIYDGGS